MKIWLINHYAVPPQYYPLARPSLFAKNLIKMGHDATIIAASTVHNSESKNLIDGKEKVKRITDDGIPYVLINCTPYQGNGFKRVLNIREFAKRLPGVLDSLEKPDVIVATSFDPISCLAGIQYAKKNGIKAISEIADLWPETLLSYSKISARNPIVRYLRRIEKRIYLESDAIVFTMEGAYDYIVEQGWQNEIKRDKVFFINNGIDFEQFKYNREHYVVDDEDLNNAELFKVVYTGSIRRVNNLGVLLDAAKLINVPGIKILIWGDGDELEALKDRVKNEIIGNVEFKGKVQKKYVPFITAKADLNIAHYSSSPILRFGVSLNKMFDYCAAGHPILFDFNCKYNPVVLNGAGIGLEEQTPQTIADAILYFANLDGNSIKEYSENAIRVAEKYDFKKLTQDLFDIMQRIMKGAE